MNELRQYFASVKDLSQASVDVQGQALLSLLRNPLKWERREEYLKRECFINGTNLITGRDTAIQKVPTPFIFCKEMVDKLIEITGDLTGKDILVQNAEYLDPFYQRDVLKNNKFCFIDTNVRKIQFVKDIYDCKNKNNIKTEEKYLPDWNTDMKFDVIVGNPPYQENDTDGNKKPSGHNLWTKFLDKSLELLKEDGYLCYVTPPFFSPAYKEIINKCFVNNTVKFINIGECGKHFPTIGTLFTYYILQKSHSQQIGTTDYICQFDDKIFKGQLNFSRNLPFIPMMVSENSLSILSKVIFGGLESIPFVEDFTTVHFVTNGRYKIRDGNNFKRTNEIHPLIRIKKIVVSKSGYMKPSFDAGHYGLTRNCFYVKVSSKLEAEKILSLLECKLYKFVLYICKWNGFTSKRVLERLPLLKNLPNNFTDANLYNYFNLTPEEVTLIEETIK